MNNMHFNAMISYNLRKLTNELHNFKTLKKTRHAYNIKKNCINKNLLYHYCHAIYIDLL